MTTPVKTRKKPAAKATAAVTEADAMHAEAMAAPLGLPLSTDALAALERESPGGPMTIIAAVRKSYDACQTITAGDCEALLEQWHGEAREAVFGPLAAWLGAPPLPAPMVVMSGGNARAALALPEPAAADPFDDSYGPRRDDAQQEASQRQIAAWAKGETISFPAIPDGPAAEPEAAEPVLAPPAAPPAAVDAAEDWDALRNGTAVIPVTDAETTTLDAVEGDAA